MPNSIAPVPFAPTSPLVLSSPIPLSPLHPASPRRFQPLHRAGAGCKPVDLLPATLQDGDEQVAEWCVLLRVEGQMLAVAPRAAGVQDGKVGRRMPVGVPQVAPEQYLRVLQQV